MRSLHSKNHQHRDEVIEAVNEDTGEVKHFANGKQCAEAIGCSSPAVYMTLDRARENKKATIKGWILKWTKDFKEDELKSLKHERSIVARTVRHGKTSERIKRLESIIENIDESIVKRKNRAKKMNKRSKRRDTTVTFIEHLRHKKKMIESQIEELAALKFKHEDENCNMMSENNNGDNK